MGAPQGCFPLPRAGQGLSPTRSTIHADSNPINGVEMPGSPRKAAEGYPHPPGEEVDANPPISSLLKGLGALNPGGEEGCPPGCPGTTIQWCVCMSGC